MSIAIKWLCITAVVAFVAFVAGLASCRASRSDAAPSRAARSQATALGSRRPSAPSAIALEREHVPVALPQQATDAGPGALETFRARSLRALRAAIGAAQCARARAEAGDTNCSASTAVSAKVRGEGDLADAAAIEVSTSSMSMGELRTVFLALRTSRGWEAFGPIAQAVSSGVGGTTSEVGVVSLRTDQLVPGGAPEVILEARSSFRDADTGIDEYETSEERWMALCGLREGEPACFGVILVETEWSRDYMTDPAELSPDERAALDPSFHPRREHRALRVTLAHDATVRVEVASGRAVSGVAGVHRIAALTPLLATPFVRE